MDIGTSPIYALTAIFFIIPPTPSNVLEIDDIDAIIREAGVQEKTIFYGVEEIITTHPVWRLFAAIKRLTPSVVQFYKLPSEKVHGVISRVEM